MPTKVTTIIRNATRNLNEPLNILTFSTHERYQQNFGFLPHNFYLWEGQRNVRTWNNKVSPLPKNHHIIPFGIFPEHAEIDLLLSQSPDVHFPICRDISQQLDIPIINLFHTFPGGPLNKIRLRSVHNTFLPHKNVFITEVNRKVWGFTENEGVVIKHAMDTDFWKPCESKQRKPYALSVVNDWPNRDRETGFGLWCESVDFMGKGMLPIRVVGNSPGLSKEAPSIEEMLNVYQTSLIFVNTSLVSPIPMSLLEAMACGLGVVSTNTGMISTIIKDNYNGLICLPEPNQIRERIITLLNNLQLCQKLGENARKTIIEQFPISNFVNSWNNVFKSILNQ